MKILWITNQATPQISQSINLNTGFGGGWMDTLSRQFSKNHNIAIAFPVSEKACYSHGHVEGTAYHAIPMKKTSCKENPRVISIYKKIILEFQPDVIHIWGTEYVHTHMAVTASAEAGYLNRVVISIQGLVSVYAGHFWGHLNNKFLFPPTLRDLLKHGFYRMHRDFIKRGKYETASIQKVRHVIGRTDWDEACTKQMNPNINYHFCNETLRESFYENQWALEKCNRHSIFVSQCYYPIKGLHAVITATAILKKVYPDIHIYTTGWNKLERNIYSRLKRTSYDRYLIKQIKKNDLEENITFLGNLREEKMCQQFLKANVFVSASSIENSPNSVGEAMLLGVPTISSDVGGVKNMLQHEKDGFIYQPDAPYMLAYYIDKIFSNDKLAESFSETARKHAALTHNQKKNFHRMQDIYESIAKEKKICRLGRT